MEEKMKELSLTELEKVSGGKYPVLPKKAGYKVYQVQPGDTMYKLAKHNKTTEDKLMACNPQITDKNLLRAGQYIYIPIS